MMPHSAKPAEQQQPEPDWRALAREACRDLETAATWRYSDYQSDIDQIAGLAKMDGG